MANGRRAGFFGWLMRGKCKFGWRTACDFAIAGPNQGGASRRHSYNSLCSPDGECSGHAPAVGRLRADRPRPACRAQPGESHAMLEPPADPAGPQDARVGHSLAPRGRRGSFRQRQRSGDPPARGGGRRSPDHPDRGRDRRVRCWIAARISRSSAGTASDTTRSTSTRRPSAGSRWSILPARIPRASASTSSPS